MNAFDTPPFKERRKRGSNVLPSANFLEFASKIKRGDVYQSRQKLSEKKIIIKNPIMCMTEIKKP